MFSRDRRREHHRFLRHQRDARAQIAPDRRRRDCTPSKRHACRTADRRSAGSDGRSCSCRRPRGRRSRPSRPACTLKRHAVEHRASPAAPDRRSAPRRTSTSPRDGCRQRDRLRRRRDLRLDVQDFEQPLGRARGLRDLAPDLADSSPRPPAANTAYSTNWPSRPGVMRAGQHVLRADPQHDDDAGEHEEDGDRGQHRARLRRRRAPPR